MTQAASRRTILAVDDTPENLDVVRAILVPDYAVKVATGGALALRIAETQKPDLILLDIMMPEMDGFEVCRRLKSQESTRDIPVIFLTARDQVQEEAQGLSTGAVDYIAKPIKPPVLRARVHTHLALSAATRQLERQNKELIEAARLREDVEHITRHDLKGPLNVIIGGPQLLLLQDGLTETQREYLRMIEESGYRMLEMINRSLDLFKMEKGIYELRPETVDLLSVMRRVMAELHTAVTEKNLRVRILVEGREPTEGQDVPVMAEGLLCHSMFSNLCKNAIEASPPGDCLTVDFFAEAGPSIATRIENGGEVPVEIRDRFFDKFVTQGKREGTGLGTYSAKLIAETQRGGIELDASVPGRTSLRVRLPKV
ncbi:MAG: response regulator [Alphaproteobacteria bacterium]